MTTKTAPKPEVAADEPIVAAKPRFKPWTRVEELPEPAEGVSLPAEYVPAYFRKRKTLAVLRAVDKSHYLVFDTSSGKSVAVKNTKEASQTMSAIRKGELAL